MRTFSRALSWASPPRKRDVRTQCSAVVCLMLAWIALAVPGAAAAAPRSPDGSMRGGGESQIDETSPDESAPGAAQRAGLEPLEERLRSYVEGSLARYDALKNESAGFRRQGWFPSLFLLDPARDVVIEPLSGTRKSVTAHISFARRDLEQRLVIAPAERFELPGADKRFFAELVGALATASPEIDHARLEFWFALLRADGQMTWELRGRIGLSAAAASRFPAGKRTAAAIWPLLDENTLPPAAWAGP